MAAVLPSCVTSVHHRDTTIRPASLDKPGWPQLVSVFDQNQPAVMFHAISPRTDG